MYADLDATFARWLIAGVPCFDGFGFGVSQIALVKYRRTRFALLAIDLPTIE
jgi:hypothetical protein